MVRPIYTDRRGNPIPFSQRRVPRVAPLTQLSTLSTLFCMVQNRAWDDVLRRAKAQPSEVLEKEGSGNTPLHVACRLDPPATVIRALQATSRVKNREGATPLHVAACHRCSAEALTVLLECCANNTAATAAIVSSDEEDDMSDDEDGVSVATKLADASAISATAELSRMGRAPIHYACMSFRGLELDAFRVLLDATLLEGNLIMADDQRRVDFDDLIDEDEDDDGNVKRDDSVEAWNQTRGRKRTASQDSFTVVNVMGIKDATGQTPLGLLFRRYRERVRCVISTVERIRGEHNHQMPDRSALAAALAVHADLGQLWGKARFIVARLAEERRLREGVPSSTALSEQPGSPGEAAVSQEAASWASEQHACAEGVDISLPPEETVSAMRAAVVPEENADLTSPRAFRIVHASVGLIGYGCPPEMIRLALAIHPHQVQEMDEDGNLPLHIAVTAASYLATAEEAAPESMGNTDNNMMDDLSVLSDTMSFFSSSTVCQTPNPFDKVIKILLQHYPEAAKIPQGKSGQLPLVMAIECGRRTWGDGIRSLLNAYPPALHNKKLFEPALYPNVLALVANGRSEEYRCVDFLDSSHHSFVVVLEDLLSLTTCTTRRPRKISKQWLRREACAKSALFELVRAKPSWLTLGVKKKEDATQASTP